MCQIFLINKIGKRFILLLTTLNPLFETDEILFVSYFTLKDISILLSHKMQNGFWWREKGRIKSKSQQSLPIYFVRIKEFWTFYLFWTVEAISRLIANFRNSWRFLHSGRVSTFNRKVKGSIPTILLSSISNFQWRESLKCPSRNCKYVCDERWGQFIKMEG